MKTAMARGGLLRHPGVVPLVFAVLNASRPAKTRAYSTVMALLLMVIVELLAVLGWRGVGWGLVAPPAIVAGICVPLYLAALSGPSPCATPSCSALSA